MADALIIDPQSIENLRALNPGDDDEFLREIVGIFFDDTPQRIAELDQSLLAGDRPRFTRAAHSIKGSSSNLGATGLQAVAEKLENLVCAQGMVDVAPLVSEVKLEYERVHAALTTIIQK